MTDPSSIVDAIDRAEDAFEERTGGVPKYEEGIASGGGWETQITKACRLIEVSEVLREQNGYYTAIIELCFGAIERSIEAYAIRMTDDELRDFQDHEYSYRRANEIGLFEEETARDMMNLYSVLPNR
ncbi:MAG: DNA-binding protein [Halobacteria archaeon]|nr:DNA-binding protein [Halobacteria archaeon]